MFKQTLNENENPIYDCCSSRTSPRIESDYSDEMSYFEYMF